MRWTFGAVLVLSVILRAAGLTTELWLDEIRGLANVAAIGSAFEVFTGIHHDSNHWLVSLWLYAVGQEAPFWLYRLPSLLAGVAAVLVAGRLAEADGSNPRLAMLLTATSFPLVFYSSEARGYSLAALSGLALFLCLLRWVETDASPWLGGYWLAASVGILSHLSFVLVLVAAVLYSLVLAGRGGLSLPRVAVLHLIPFLVLGSLVAIDLRYLGIGGGTPEPPSTLLARTASLAIGGPIEGRGVPWFAVIAAALVLAELARRIRRFWPDRRTTESRPHSWVFFASIALLPAWVALALNPPFLFPRYFLVAMAFVPLLVASFASALSRPWPALLLAAWLALNGYSFARFLQEGRGQYEEALRFLLATYEGEVIAVGSDHDLRNERILDFYRGRMGPDATRLRYVNERDRSEQPIAFWIGSYEGSRCGSCVLLRSYPSSSLSGARWSLYRAR